MSDQIKDGGPAFPLPDTYHSSGAVEYGSVGMTLRDYFAAKAMQAYMTGDSISWALDGIDCAAGSAYAMADAMLRARGAK